MKGLECSLVPGKLHQVVQCIKCSLQRENLAAWVPGISKNLMASKTYIKHTTFSYTKPIFFGHQWVHSVLLCLKARGKKKIAKMPVIYHRTLLLKLNKHLKRELCKLQTSEHIHAFALKNKNKTSAEKKCKRDVLELQQGFAAQLRSFTMSIRQCKCRLTKVSTACNAFFSAISVQFGTCQEQPVLSNSLVGKKTKHLDYNTETHWSNNFKHNQRHLQWQWSWHTETNKMSKSSYLPPVAMIS